MTQRNRRISVALFVAAGVLAVLSLVFVGRYAASIVHAGNSEDGTEPPAIMDLSFPEGHVGEYAHGVADYQKRNFAEAEEHFAAAAENGAGEPDDCDIRVNWALSICYQIDFSVLDTDEQKAEAVARLMEASDILCEHGCAVKGRQGEWHDDDAQQLEDDIEKMLEDIQSQGDGDGDQDQDQDQSQQEPPESEEEKQQRQQKQDELQNQRSQAMAESQKERQYWEQGDGDFNYGGKGW